MKTRFAFALLALTACHGTEQDARKYLEQQGYEPVEVKRDGNVFFFTAKKGKDLCKGSIAMKKGFGSSSQTMTSSCELDTTACKAGAPKECMAIADDLYAKDTKVFPLKASELYRTACADKEARGCARAAEFEQIDKHWPAVREFSTKACDLGSGDGCQMLARTEHDGHGTDKNEAKAIELAKKACELGSNGGCRDAAGYLIDGKHPADAIPIADKICKAQYQDACAVLGIAYFDTKTNLPTALDYLEKSCNNPAEKSGITPGFVCNLAAVIVLEGAGGVKKDPVRGIAFLEKSCEKDFPVGCSNAGRNLQKGLNGVKKDTPKGLELLTKACKLGYSDACKP